MMMMNEYEITKCHHADKVRTPIYDCYNWFSRKPSSFITVCLRNETFTVSVYRNRIITVSVNPNRILSVSFPGTEFSLFRLMRTRFSLSTGWMPRKSARREFSCSSPPHTDRQRRRSPPARLPPESPSSWSGRRPGPHGLEIWVSVVSCKKTFPTFDGVLAVRVTGRLPVVEGDLLPPGRKGG